MGLGRSDRTAGQQAGPPHMRVRFGVLDLTGDRVRDVDPQAAVDHQHAGASRSRLPDTRQGLRGLARRRHATRRRHPAGGARFAVVPHHTLGELVRAEPRPGVGQLPRLGFVGGAPQSSMRPRTAGSGSAPISSRPIGAQPCRASVPRKSGHASGPTPMLLAVAKALVRSAAGGRGSGCRTRRAICATSGRLPSTSAIFANMLDGGRWNSAASSGTGDDVARLPAATIAANADRRHRGRRGEGRQALAGRSGLASQRRMAGSVSA